MPENEVIDKKEECPISDTLYIFGYIGKWGNSG